jgi:hypothetical protein
VAISNRTRILQYLGSPLNLAGSGLALVALFVTTITGLGGALWPLLVVLVYIIGVAIGRLYETHGQGTPHHPAAPKPRRAAK